MCDLASPRLAVSCFRARQIFSDLPFTSGKVGRQTAPMREVLERSPLSLLLKCAWMGRSGSGMVGGSRLRSNERGRTKWVD